MVRPREAGDYLKMGLLVRLCIVGMAFRIQHIHKMARQPFPFRCHHESGNNKAASLLLVGFANVSNTKDMLIGRPARRYSVPPPSHLIERIRYFGGVS